MLTGLAPSVEEELVQGQAEILQVFPIKGKRGVDAGAVAGCRVTDGHIKTSGTFRILRSGEVHSRIFIYISLHHPVPHSPCCFNPIYHQYSSHPFFLQASVSLPELISIQ